MSSLPARLQALAIALILLVSAIAEAHDLGIARVTLSNDAAGRLSIDARSDAAITADGITLPARCQADGVSSRAVVGGDDQWQWHYQCGDLSFSNSDQLILDWPVEGVFVSSADSGQHAGGQFFDEEEGRIVLPLAEILSTSDSAPVSFVQYLRFGVEHILSGWDHLAFVLALCLIAVGWRLFKLITAFTVGHSITLALASFGWISLPAPPLEACIALSIAFIAREAVLNRKDQHGYLIVLGFGLLHGMGFARALGEAGIAADNLLAALLAFNIGVEIGQIIFVLAVLVVARLIVRKPNAQRLRAAAAYAIGSLGLFWTLERTTQFFT